MHFIVLAALLNLQPTSNGYALQTTTTQRIEATLTFDVRYPNVKAAEWVLIAPHAPELASQRNVTSLLEPAGMSTREQSPLARPILAGRFAVKGGVGEKDIKIRVTYQADLIARQLVVLKPGDKMPAVKELPAEKRAQALRATELNNFQDRAFQAWLMANNLRRLPGEGDVDLARRVFLKIQKNFKYDYTLDMDRHATHVCKSGKSDCGGMSIVFVSAMRANGVPARLLVGRWAIPGLGTKPTKLGDLVVQDYGGQHAVAEFYAHGVGWVPVDPASGVVHDKSAVGLEYFGRSKANFLTLHVDEGLVIDSVHFGKHAVPWLQGPTWWVMGQGNLEQPQMKENWHVRKLDVK